MNVHILLILVCVAMLWSGRINTDTFLKILGIGMVLIGCVLALDGKQSLFIEIGAICYFVCDILNSFRADRRKT